MLVRDVMVIELLEEGRATRVGVAGVVEGVWVGIRRGVLVEIVGGISWDDDGAIVIVFCGEDRLDRVVYGVLEVCVGWEMHVCWGGSAGGRGVRVGGITVEVERVHWRYFLAKGKRKATERRGFECLRM